MELIKELLFKCFTLVGENVAIYKRPSFTR